MDPGLGSIRDQADVKIVWKGRRIAKLIFPTGKIVEFDESVGPATLRVINRPPDRAITPQSQPSKAVDETHDR